MDMPTGYDLLEHSHEFRMHMLSRVAAALIDASLIFIPIAVVIYYLEFEPLELLIGVFSGFGWFIYSAISESKTGTTLGKRVLGLIVASKDGPMTLSKGIVRNVPKMFWYIFLVIDVFVGLVMKDDPRQRWTDKIAATVVVKK
jgi:uncharacterized RDD family membrane protein YckC